MSKVRSIAGVVLAGGGARRMFPHSPTGGDKALAVLGTQPLIAHVVARLAPQVPRLIINANGDPQRYARLGLEVVPDAREPDQGPLAGLLAAMIWAQRTAPDVDAIVTVSTDTPFLPFDLVQRLAGEAADGPAVAASFERVHPVIGLWPLGLRASLECALAQQRRSVEKFARQHDAVAVGFEPITIGGLAVDPFFNANTPEDLAQAHTLLALNSPTKDKAHG